MNRIYLSTLARHKKRLHYILLACFISACSMDGLIFYPHPKLVTTPAKAGIAYETIEIVTQDDIRLHNWLIKPEGKAIGRILFLHGNAENISTHIRNVYWLPQHGYEVLLVDYRGFGQSQGVPGLPEVFFDIEASFNWLQLSNSDQLPLFVMGQSLGASLAAYSVGFHPEWEISGLVLDAPFASYRDIAREKMSELWLTWPVQYPLSWLFPDDYSPKHVAGNISPRPLLMFYSELDTIVRGVHSRTLFDQVGEPKTLIITKEQHIGTFNNEEHRQKLLDFLNKYKSIMTARI